VLVMHFPVNTAADKNISPQECSPGFIRTDRYGIIRAIISFSWL